MIKFKIYINEFGWEMYSLKNTLYETKLEVDKLKDKRILVIQHDTELKQDQTISIKELIKK